MCIRLLPTIIMILTSATNPFKSVENFKKKVDFIDEAIKAIHKEGVKNTFSEALYQYIVDSETADFNFESALEFLNIKKW